MSLARFHEAQADRHTGYDAALAEIRRGRKTSHWIWYVFPQLAVLGRSSTARAYGIRDLAEACDYLRDPILRARYQEITAAVGDQLGRGIAVEELMGSHVDALKLVSSMTLFRAAADSLASDNPPFTSLAQLCASVLAQTTAQGYAVCLRTTAQVAA